MPIIGDVIMVAINILAIAMSAIVTARHAPIGAIVSTWSMSAVFALVTVLAFVWRRRKMKVDFTALSGTPGVYGVSVVRGGLDRVVTDQNISSWLDGVVSIMSRPGSAKSRTEIIRCVDRSMISYVDAEKLTLFGRWLRGYTVDNGCCICYRGLTYAQICALTQHEFGHLVLMRTGRKLSEEKQHEILRSYGL